MLKTFRIGGIHPPENKLSANAEIENFPVPRQVIIPLAQHIGAPANLLVKKGDLVQVGTLLAESAGFISANIHSSVSGRVAKIDQAMGASGYRKMSVFIDVEGDEWDAAIDKSDIFIDTCDFTAKEIISKIAAAGIVGMGGAAFPTLVKLNPPLGMSAEILIVNGVECEPYLTSDHALMMSKGKEILVGTQLLMRSLGALKGAIGIENNKKDAIKLMKELALAYTDIEIVPLKVRYPQGGEKQLVEAITNRQIASGSLPISVGAVVQNIGTVFAVYEAVQKNKPLIERVITVTGKHLAKPCNLRVRIGTSIADLIEYAGGLPEDTGKVIFGGPMMGKALVTMAVPVVKACSGILILPSLESKREFASDCIRCAKCVDVCPMGLVPNYLMTVSDFADWGKAEKFDIVDCIECGSCTYICPANRPLLDYIRIGKVKVGSIIRARKN
ncbi:electron transport complex subunit C [Bacteroidales bacterium]|nr:electron transport complex subunit C [Bacteroidales bacterium]